jgi:large subunit ribosomal protein L6
LYGKLMSRIGKKPVDIPGGVKIERKGRCIKVTGPLGELQMDCHPRIKVKIDDAGGKIVVENKRPQDRQNKQLHGTMRALIANMVAGVSKGFEKKMEIFGTGYNVKEQGGKLAFQVGFCHPVELVIPKGIKVNIDVGATRGNDVPARFTLSGTDKCLLGQFAADIRKIRPPEPYKGKGIRYADEHVRRKVGKAFASGAA